MLSEPPSGPAPLGVKPTSLVMVKEAVIDAVPDLAVGL
jgi:hypothetical protein